MQHIRPIHEGLRKGTNNKPCAVMANETRHRSGRSQRHRSGALGMAFPTRLAVENFNTRQAAAQLSFRISPTSLPRSLGHVSTSGSGNPWLLSV